MTLFISTQAGNSSSAIYSIPGLARECRGARGLKKDRADRDHIHGGARKKKKSSYLFFDDVLTLMCLTQTKQRATICCLDSAPTVITDVSSTPASGDGSVSRCTTWVQSQIRRRLFDCNMTFCGHIHGPERIGPDDFGFLQRHRYWRGPP